MRLKCFAVAIMIVVACAPASANDSAAALGAGGLVLLEQKDIRMVSEDLTISQNAIAIRYEFLNDSTKPIKTRVAFPLPDVNLADLRESGVGWPNQNAEDPVNFTISVGGVPVKPAFESRAILNGKDITGELKAAKIPVGLPLGDAWSRVAKVKKSEIDRLAAKGYLDAQTYPGEVWPLYTIKSTYHWEQTFPPGEIVKVAHDYTPIVGGSFLGMKDNEAKHATFTNNEFYKDFCIDEGTHKAMVAMVARQEKKTGEQTMLVYSNIRYVLKTGANWKGPIGRFKLTVDKGAPGNIVSFCATGVKKTGPTTFVVEKTDYEPDQDLAILIAKSIEPAQ